MRYSVLAILGIAVCVLAFGCGGDSGPSVPTSAEVARCFEDEGVPKANQSTEQGVPTVRGLISGDEVVGVELTEDESKTEERLKFFESLESFEAFPALDGQAVGVVSEAKNKDLVLNCLEQG